MERKPNSDEEAMRCPGCRRWMRAGALNCGTGLMWLPHSEASTMFFAETLPGTQSVNRPNRLPAWRCASCETVLLRYGRDAARQASA